MQVEVVVSSTPLRGHTALCLQRVGAWLGVCVQDHKAQLRAAGGERCAVVALRTPTLFDCRKPSPPYNNKHAPLQSVWVD